MIYDISIGTDETIDLKLGSSPFFVSRRKEVTGIVGRRASHGSRQDTSEFVIRSVDARQVHLSMAHHKQNVICPETGLSLAIVTVQALPARRPIPVSSLALELNAQSYHHITNTLGTRCYPSPP